MQNDKYMGQQPPQSGFISAPPAGNYPPAQHYPAQNYPPQNYPPQGYPAQNYPPQGYPAQNYPPQNYGPPPPPPTQQGPTVVVVTPSGSWFARNQRNKAQSNSLSAASLIFLSGGMNIAWSVGFRSVWGISLHVRVCWFIGAIIGAFISGFLANKVPKKIIFQFCSMLVLIGGIVLASTHYNISAITAALYLDGIANGLAFAPMLALAGEVSVPYLRGLVSSTEQMSYVGGIFIQVIFATTWTWNTNGTVIATEQIHGILSAIWGFIGLLLAFFLVVESPVILLANGEEQAAIDALRRLQRPQAITSDTYAQLEEHKHYLAQNKDLSNAQSIRLAMPAFLRLCLLRGMNSMSICIYLVYTLIYSTLVTQQLSAWPYLLFALLRWFGNIITSIYVESLGRKKPILFGLLVCSVIAVVIGIELQSFYEDFYVIMIMLCIYQFFAGMCFAPTSAYLSEAYPLGVKQHFISFTFIFEMLVFILIAACPLNLIAASIFCFFMTGIYFVALVLGIFCLPETKMTTLRMAQNKFRGFISKGF